MLAEDRGLLWRWFVRYNPLYFFSALCVLSGVHLISVDLYESGWLGGRLFLLGALQAYEVLLLVGVAVLFRTEKGRRAATILAIVAVALLFDPTFQIEAVTTVGQGDPAIGLLWAALAAAKLATLARVLRLESAGRAVLAGALGAAGLAGFASLLAHRVAPAPLVLLGATWYASAILCWVARTRPCSSSSAGLDEWGRTVLRRAQMAAVLGWTALYLYHVVQWSRIYDVTLTSAHLAPLVLVIAFAGRQEATAWVGAAMTIVWSLSMPAAVMPASVAAAAALLWLAWHGGPRRLVTGGVCAAFVAAAALGWREGGPPEPELWLVAQTALVLIVVAWLHRLPSAGIVGGAIVLAGGARYALTLGRLGAGTLLVIVGFAALVVGIVLERERGRTLPPGGTAGRWPLEQAPAGGPLFTFALACSLVLAAAAPLVAGR